MRLARRLFLLALFVGLFWVAWHFTHRNQSEIIVDLVARQSPPVPIWMALLVSFGLGVVLASATFAWQLAKKSLVARRYRKAVTGLESEIHELRNLPLASEEGPGLREPTSTPPAELADRSA